MLLNSVSAIAAFPNEILEIDLNNISPSLVNTRMGISFVDSYYEYGNLKYNWDNISLSAYESTAVYFMPSAYVSVPDEFPLYYTVSGYTDHLLLSFTGGLSAISVWPSRPYPIITKINNSTISVSAGLLNATAFNEDISTTEFRKSIDINTLNYYPSAISLKGAYQTVIQRGRPLAELVNPVGTTFANRFFGAKILHKPYYPGSSSLERVIPESCLLQLPFQTPVVSADSQIYNIYWDKTHTAYTGPGANSYMTRLYSPPIEYIAEDGGVTPLNPAIVIGYSPTLSLLEHGECLLNTGVLYPLLGKPYYLQSANISVEISPHLVLTPASSIYIPQYSDATFWCEISSQTFANQMQAVQLSTNYFTFSSYLPPYLHGYAFESENQRAFTINYAPSAHTVLDEVSSVSMQTSMIDNFYQTSFDISSSDNFLISRFLYLDETLSAKDVGSELEYISNQWFPSSATMKFFNKGNAKNYTIEMETSSIFGSYFIQHDIPLILNRDQAIISLTKNNSTDNSVEIQGAIFPDYDETAGVIWSVFPPENIVIRDLYTNEVIPLNTLIEGGSLAIKVENLGVDTTTITLYSEQYSRYASTTWSPSNDIWENVVMRLDGSVTDYEPINRGSLSAFFVKNNFKYRVPTSANIQWSETYDSPLGEVSFISSSGIPIVETATYPSTNQFSIINADFETTPATINPSYVNYRIECAAFASLFNLRATKSFGLRQYPYNSNLFAEISSPYHPTPISSEIYSSVIIPDTTTVNLTANIENLNVDEYDILWSNGVTSLTGLTASFSISDPETCIGVSALNVTPSGGGFGAYNFSDTICFYILSTLTPFDYISFPKYNYLPTEEITFDNYTTSFIEMTSYSACHTEYIMFSALSGFDQYYWTVDDVTTITTANTASVPIINTSNGTITVSAFNRYFPREDPLSIYNTASATGLGYKQNLNFVDFPTMELGVIIDPVVINMRELPDRVVNFSGEFSGLDVSTTNMTIVLSSEDGVYHSPVNISNNTFDFNRIFTYGVHDAFSIPENSYHVYNMFLSGDVYKTINDFDFCTTVQDISSNIISVTAYDGPTLDIWSAFHSLSTNQEAIIHNTTNNYPANPFTSFTFEDGLGNYTTHSTFSAFSAIYDEDGSYSVSLTGNMSDGRILTKTWNSFFIVGSGDDYNPKINRTFVNDLNSPYDLQDVLVPANSWQTNTTLNTSFDRIQKNIDYITTQCFSINNNTAQLQETYGSYRGVSKWRYAIDLSLLEANSDYIDILFYDDAHIFIINGQNIELRSNDAHLTLLNTFYTINGVEEFLKPSKIQKLGNDIVVLGMNIIYIFSVDLDMSNITIKNIWNTQISKNSKTTIINATDIFTTNTKLFVLDAGSNNIKVYNRYFNWIDNISVPGIVKSISGDSENLFVLTENGILYTISDRQIVDTIVIDSGTNMAINPFNQKIILNSGTSKIQVYAKNGTFINTIEPLSTHIPLISRVYKNETFILYSHIIVKVVDLLQYEKITTQESDFTYPSTYKVGRNEPVTSFIINDSIGKLYANLNTLNISITGQNLKYYNEDDAFSFSTVSSVSPKDCTNYAQLGVNELVSYETINRELKKIHTCILNTLDHVNGTKSYSSIPPVWTWIYHKVNKNQHPSINRTPLSWEELYSTNPTFSATSWNSVGFSTGFENSFPAPWTWVGAEACKVNSITWEEMESGKMQDYTWEELENIFKFSEPSTVFTDC